MPEAQKRKVKYAKLHQPFFAPGGPGDIPSTLPPDRKTWKNLEMTWDSIGLELSFEAESQNVFKKVNILIPAANVCGVVFKE